MKKVFDNLINGNLEDAKRGAKRYGTASLTMHCTEELGFTWEQAFHAVNYLKNGGSFQAYCDAK